MSSYVRKLATATEALNAALKSGLPEDKMTAVQAGLEVSDLRGGNLGRPILYALMRRFENYPPGPWSMPGTTAFNSAMPSPDHVGTGVMTGWTNAEDAQRYELVGRALGTMSGVQLSRPVAYDEYLEAASRFVESYRVEASARHGQATGAMLQVVDFTVPGTILHRFGVEVLEVDETNLRRIHLERAQRNR